MKGERACGLYSVFDFVLKFKAVSQNVRNFFIVLSLICFVFSGKMFLRLYLKFHYILKKYYLNVCFKCFKYCYNIFIRYASKQLVI